MKIYINDKEYLASEGETIIQVADRNNIHIPRFCYHKHLSVVASCRMCLVEIDKVKQAQPACSTLVHEDMHVNTKSQKTKDLIESVGCRIVFLPPYSPDLNPIEKFLANMKRWIKDQISDFTQ